MPAAVKGSPLSDQGRFLYPGELHGSSQPQQVGHRCGPAEYVGSLDVPRPNSRVEIVAAMRRIRVPAALHPSLLDTCSYCVPVSGMRPTWTQ
ncbi:Carboxyl-terminal PDZ ligand of neuronal nitric oxide synthase protein [Tupaia chinensis]|uniref:Carboxyl-terminal PDZ ligand of neuronal nitric oxide synthase protein n=1 Tax=Tupaia chinensis TaxID=246437 RepID=L9L8H8_TUPCH|nr:Carboxyl-terminal PDZ ligand of neuronal nitric oxide synthase protein [Tupaia chinensis]